MTIISSLLSVGLATLCLSTQVFGDDANMTSLFVEATSADLSFPLSSSQSFNIVNTVHTNATSEESVHLVPSSSNLAAASCSCPGCASESIGARSTTTWSLINPCSGGAQAVVTKYNIGTTDGSDLYISTRTSTSASNEFTSGSWANTECVRQTGVNVGGLSSNIYVMVKCLNLIFSCPVVQDIDFACIGGNSWQYTGVSQCSATCGGGTKTYTYMCKDTNGFTVASSLCSGNDPSYSETCNSAPCATYSWVQGTTTQCSSSCGSGTKTVNFDCRSSTGQTVSGSFCSGYDPSHVQACNTQSCGSDSGNMVSSSSGSSNGGSSSDSGSPKGWVGLWSTNGECNQNQCCCMDGTVTVKQLTPTAGLITSAVSGQCNKLQTITMSVPWTTGNVLTFTDPYSRQTSTLYLSADGNTIRQTASSPECSGTVTRMTNAASSQQIGASVLIMTLVVLSLIM